MNPRSWTAVPFLAALAVLLAVPLSAGGEKTHRRAKAELYPTKGSKVHGVVEFTEVKGGVLVRAEVSGLSPGNHGFHIHEFGDCSAPDGASAGGHFNPERQPHGGPHGGKRHVGDLGNLKAGRDGKAEYLRLDKHLQFDGKRGILGRAVIVHAGEDDLKSQPTGGAGGRVACGVIGWIEETASIAGSRSQMKEELKK